MHPYTDLLLHDMGAGLADDSGLPEASEWRTAPLWGLGFTAQVSGAVNLLHDGRAGSVLEAVLWHGGEAQAARDAVVALPREDRLALLAFLDSL
ncbi:di-heme oxidoredictase family protein [Archangium violaceum]|uniref:di-heme oxidoredictase family protein n=1 Tax=Archangium violaceum TaxID=83451 RepID=UPI001EF612D6|nr:di-heme oxidoredictase family protein [Archangium violaceum]